MSTNEPRRGENPKPVPPKSEAADSASLPTIDLGQEGAVDLGDFQAPDGSAIALAALPEPPSGQSLTTWTEVIRRQRAALAAAEAAEGVEVDAPSDQDLLGRVEVSAPKPAQPKRPGDTSEIRPADLPVYAPPLATPASESEIDLSRPTPGASPTGSVVGFEILHPPADAAGAMRVGPESFTGRAKIGDSEEAALGTSASGDNLGPPSGEPGRSSILDVLLRESNGGQPPAAEPVSDLLDFDDSFVAPLPKVTMPNLPGFAGRPPAIPTQPGIDLAANGPPTENDLDVDGPDSRLGSDEEVDLYVENNRPPSISDSGSLEISEHTLAESQRRAELQESSAIDMNSVPSLNSADFQLPSDVVKPVAKAGSESDVDLRLPEAADQGSSSVIMRPSALELDHKALVAEVQARRQKSTDAARNGKRARPSRAEVVPARDDEVPPARRRGFLLHGGVLGLLLGAGGVLAAYFGGALPDRHSRPTAAAADNSAALAQLRQEVGAAKNDADQARASVEEMKKSLTAAGINPENPADSVKQLASGKEASDARIRELMAASSKLNSELTAAQTDASKAAAAAEAATKALTTAMSEAAEARKQVAELTKSVEAGKAEVLAVRKLADAKDKDAATRVAAALKLVDAKDKEATAKLADAAKREMTLAAAVDAAKKAAEDATKARDAQAATLAAIGDRLAKARFVGEKPDPATIVKGLDSAIKAASTDATSSLRDELAKAQASESKLQGELAAAVAKEANAAKTAAALRADQDKLTAEAAKYKATADKLSKELADAAANAAAAEKLASEQKASAEQLAAESSRLKVDNDRLARDLQAVRELADLIKSQPASTHFSAKPDPAKLADRFFDEGLRSYYAGEYAGAQSSFRKALQFRPDDARYHYLLGLSLWMAHDLKAAQSAFESGRDLELDARPPSRVISAVLERIQGPARQAVNAYRP